MGILVNWNSAGYVPLNNIFFGCRQSALRKMKRLVERAWTSVVSLLRWACVSYSAKASVISHQLEGYVKTRVLD